MVTALLALKMVYRMMSRTEGMRKRTAVGTLSSYFVKESEMPYAKQRTRGERANPMKVFNSHALSMTLGVLHLKMNLQNDYTLALMIPNTPSFLSWTSSLQSIYLCRTIFS